MLLSANPWICCATHTGGAASKQNMSIFLWHKKKTKLIAQSHIKFLFMLNLIKSHYPKKELRMRERYFFPQGAKAQEAK
jgi:hypothetical protein